MAGNSVIRASRLTATALYALALVDKRSAAGDLEEIPYLITPNEVPQYRESIYVAVAVFTLGLSYTRL